jgi:hypothetical protein
MGNTPERVPTTGMQKPSTDFADWLVRFNGVADRTEKAVLAI